MSVLNFGSLNVDHVYRVPHIVAPGETLTGRSYQLFAGGKGANQSVALARAGAKVAHAGKVGRGGEWLLDKLQDAGVDTSMVEVTDEPTGHAVIQVDDAGENAIFLYPGTNHQITQSQIDRCLDRCDPGTVLLLQNETNHVGQLIERGHARGLTVCLNPAPFDENVADYPLNLVDLLIVNESEAMGLAGADSPDAALAALCGRLPDAAIILTRGSRGVSYRDRDSRVDLPAQRVEAVDTTAAGDTFIGYYLAGAVAGCAVEESLTRATHAAARCVATMGAMDSIPTL